MKKSLLCVIMAILLMFQCFPIVNAEDWTDQLDVDIDMEVRQSGTSAFKNGPVYITGTSAKADFKATLEMSPVFSKFIEWYNKGIDLIEAAVGSSGALHDQYVNELNNLEITGEFIVNIIYPKTLGVPDTYKANTHSMQGFNTGALNAFYEIERNFVENYDANNSLIRIKIGVRDLNNAVDQKLYAGSLFANKDTYLDDLTLTFNNITVPSPGTYTIKGTMSGSTQTDGTFGTSTGRLRVDYTGKQPSDKENPLDTSNISASVVLSRPQSSGGSSTNVTFNIDGDTTFVESISKNTAIKLDKLPVPERAGYTFKGWYYDSALTNKVAEPVSLKGDVVLYGHWISDTLETEDHFAYVIGYPDGTVRPENDITREEVATIFYRLLRENKIVDIATTENDFTDVTADRWSNKAISSLTNGGYLTGYEDGTFRPENSITRAEFATMASRFAQIVNISDKEFTDLEGHWANEYILKAAGEGWIEGYEDGTFRPENSITRAEVMTIINRMLVRYVDAEGLHKDTVLWIDMNGTEWYYYNVLEATNSHDYDRREDGKLENWTSINENRIWIELDEMENAD